MAQPKGTSLGIVWWLAAAVALGLWARGPDRAEARAETLVFVNGRATRVSFNDGDSFRMLNGPYAQNQTRLAGFNTLESFGPAHRWGGWTAYELYAFAKLATLNGQRGVWHCYGSGERDGYGRVLLDCPDLAIDMIRKGLAHAMQVDDTPARPEYLRAQHEAMRAGRGMWAKGVPEFIVSSVHSAAEDPGRDDHMNRMVSTWDGHSEKFLHNDTYAECQEFCATERVAGDMGRVRAFARALRADPSAGRLVAGLSNILVIEIITRYVRLDTLPEWVDPSTRDALTERLARAKRAGLLGEAVDRPGSCFLYVDFRRRYGMSRPACLRGHGGAH